MKPKYRDYLGRGQDGESYLVFTRNRQKFRRIAGINQRHGYHAWLRTENPYTLMQLLELEYASRKDYSLKREATYDHEQPQEVYDKLVILYDFEEFRYFNYQLKDLLKDLKREGQDLNIHIIEISEREINQLEKTA